MEGKLGVVVDVRKIAHTGGGVTCVNAKVGVVFFFKHKAAYEI